MHFLPGRLWRLLTVGLVAAAPIAGFVVARTLDNRPALHDGTVAMTAIIDETIAALGPARQTALNHVDMAAPPFEKLEDRLDYNRCDSWRELVFPGWEAGLSYTVATNGDRDRADLFATVEALWLTHGGELKGGPEQNGGLALDLEHSHYRLYVNQITHEVELFGATRCLPR
ncbi:MAG: hypothetical protein ACRDJW_06555 [Thermomicrobiales bacterium]